MSNATYESLCEEVRTASATNDAHALVGLADELRALDTPQSLAKAEGALALGSQLRGDYANAYEQYQRAITMYRAINDIAGEADATLQMANVNYRVGNASEARANYAKSLALFEQLGDRTGIARATGNIANLLCDSGDYSSAATYYQHALSEYEISNDASGIARITYNVGSMHYRVGNYSSALEHYYNALEHYGLVHDTAGTPNVLGSIGNVFWRIGNDAEALKFYHQALCLHEDRTDRSAMASVTGNIGNVYAKANDYGLALEYYERALALHMEMGEVASTARVTGNIVATLIAFGRLAEARTLLRTMDEMTIDDPSTIIAREQSRALLQEADKDLDGAITTLLAALDLARKNRLSSHQAELHRCLRDIALTSNDFASYVVHNNEFSRLTEESSGKDTALKISMLERKRELDARDKEHAKYLAVLYATLPKSVAIRVAQGETIHDSYDDAAILFLDIVDFTTNSSALEASAIVQLLQSVFSTFDERCSQSGITKIKTNGDGYMAAAFPSDSHITCLASAATAMMSSAFTWPHSGQAVTFRIGLHIGPVTAGVIGTERLQYDVWGDTVNVASRMESTGEPGRIHVSDTFADALRSAPYHNFTLTERGTIDVKGKGAMKTYWLEGGQVIDNAPASASEQAPVEGVRNS